MTRSRLSSAVRTRRHSTGPPALLIRVFGLGNFFKFQARSGIQATAQIAIFLAKVSHDVKIRPDKTAYDTESLSENHPLPIISITPVRAATWGRQWPAKTAGRRPGSWHT